MRSETEGEAGARLLFIDGGLIFLFFSFLSFFNVTGGSLSLRKDGMKYEKWVHDRYFWVLKNRKNMLLLAFFQNDTTLHPR